MSFAQDLRASVLQAAMQGKLTEQLETDTPVSELLADIKAEKGRLISEKKIRKDKHNAFIAEDEMLTDIPSNWTFLRFGDIVANYDSQRKPISKEKRENGVYDYYGATGSIDKVADYIFDGEYLLIGEDGGNFFVPRPNSFIASGKFWANNHVHVVQPLVIDIKYLMHFLNSLNLPAMNLIRGIAVPKLNQQD